MAAAPLASSAATPLQPVRLGGPIFLKSDDPDALAREHRQLGYTAAYCPNAKVEDTDRVRAIEKAFASAGVVIAEVGAWVNMLEQGPEKRRKNLDYVQSRLALADAVGALNCVDIAGSYNPDKWDGPHPKNFSQECFDATVENCRKLIDAVKPRRTKLTIEMMGWVIPEGPDRYLRLIKAVDRPAFAAHMDICNVINSVDRFYNNAAFIRECFSKLARWIQSCHAKDLYWQPEPNLHFIEVIPGRGGIDYAAYLTEIAKLPHRPPLMLEHLRKAEEYQEGADHIRKVGAKAGITFA